jgi:Rad3-related DNA helicase
MIKTLNKIIDDIRVPERINQGNYKTYLKALVEFYGYVKSEFEEAAISATRTSNTKAYVKMNRATKRYEGLACKIGDFLSFEYPHVFEYKEEEKSVTVKPIFAAEMMETLQLGRFNLFMSATISPAYAERTLGLSDENSRFIQLDPTFPKENKEMVFFDPLPLSYKSLQDPEIVERLCKNVVKIVKHHVELGERGIILTPSFALQKKITDILERQKWFSGVSYFKQERGEKLEPVLREFKDHEGGPALLVSPGMFEGVDLPGDLSRFQILVKAPFPSLADKRAKVILDRYPDVYNITATMKLVQGAGRSVRSATDYAVTYCLDKNAARIFSSKSNIWQNEFTIRHTSFL